MEVAVTRDQKYITCVAMTTNTSMYIDNVLQSGYY